MDQRALARAGRPQDGDQLSRTGLEVDAAEGGGAGLIVEGDLLKPDVAADPRQSYRIRPLQDRRLGVQHLEDPLSGGGGLGPPRDQETCVEGLERHEAQIEHEGGDLAGAQPAGRHLSRPQPQDRENRRVENEVRLRSPRHRQQPASRVLLPHGRRPILELSPLVAARSEGLDHADARKALLHDRRHVSGLRLSLPPCRDQPGDYGKAAPQGNREQEDYDKTEPPVHGDHQRRGPSRVQHKIGYVGEPIRREVPHGIDVAGGARHQVAGLLAVVVSELMRCSLLKRSPRRRNGTSWLTDSKR